MFAHFSGPVRQAVGVIAHCLIPGNGRDHAFGSLENQSAQSHCHGLAADVHRVNEMVASGIMAGQVCATLNQLCTACRNMLGTIDQ
jgi:hypothetical protein